jgi:hypothetical protein
MDLIILVNGLLIIIFNHNKINFLFLYYISVKLNFKNDHLILEKN